MSVNAFPEITDGNFGLLVDRYGSELRSRCLHFANGNPQAADDLLQTTFADAWSMRAKFRGGNARAWLYQLARFRGLDAARRRGRLQPIAPERLHALLNADSYEAEHTDVLALDQLPSLLESLEPLERWIVELAFGIRPVKDCTGSHLELTYAEIGAVLERDLAVSMKPAAIRMRLTRILEKLLHRLEAGEVQKR